MSEQKQEQAKKEPQAVQAERVENLQPSNQPSSVEPSVKKEDVEKSSGESTVLSLDASLDPSEKFFGELAPLARVLLHAIGVLDEETRLVAGRSPLNALRVVAQQKEALLTQHDLQLLRLKGKTDDFSVFVSRLDEGVRARLRALYSRFEEALRKNGLRLKAALASSEMLLAALSEAAQAESVKGPQLYTPQGRLSETDSVSFSRSIASESEV